MVASLSVILVLEHMRQKRKHHPELGLGPSYFKRAPNGRN